MSDLDTFNNALIECVKAAGGSKKVGPMLWPEKTVDQAQRLLLACLNDERPEKLSPDQALLIMRLAKESGCHAGMEYLCRSLSYSAPVPVEPVDEFAQLQKEFIQASKAMEVIASRLEHLQAPAMKIRVAA
jgi:hypothetical protein